MMHTPTVCVRAKQQVGEISIPTSITIIRLIMLCRLLTFLS
jgi:hypothetical protein